MTIKLKSGREIFFYGDGIIGLSTSGEFDVLEATGETDRHPFLTVRSPSGSGTGHVYDTNLTNEELIEIADCPSSDNVRLIRRFAKRGSGSSGVRV